MTDPTEALKTEIGFYEQQKPMLVQHHNGKWVLIRGAELIGVYDTFDTAAREAVERFGSGPYLIRQVGSEPGMAMPASVAYRPVYAPS